MDVTKSVDTKNPQATNKEVRRIYESLFGSDSFEKVEYALEIVVELFNGNYTGYEKCDTFYHNLEHTLQAYLAMARIIDGLFLENHVAMPKELVVLGLISALGHDTGYIRKIGEVGGSGARYTLVHVNRSKEFMGNCLPGIKFNPSQIQCVKNIISCTGVKVDLSTIRFTSEPERETGYILGTADYLGQMSDPDYPEKLPILYKELNEGGVRKYPSVQYLIKETPTFFENFVMKRLTSDFHSVYRFSANHFGGKNLYIDGIKRNIARLKRL